MRRWAALVVVLIGLVSALATSCGGGGDDDESGAESVGQTAETVDAAPEETAPRTAETDRASDGASAALTDQGWSVVPGSITLEKDFVDDFDGSMRIENGTAGPAAAVFTLRVLKDGQPVGTVRAFTVGSIEPGQVEEVMMISTDDYVPGPYTFEFQTDRVIPGRQAPGRRG